MSRAVRPVFGPGRAAHPQPPAEEVVMIRPLGSLLAAAVVAVLLVDACHQPVTGAVPRPSPAPPPATAATSPR